MYKNNNDISSLHEELEYKNKFKNKKINNSKLFTFFAKKSIYKTLDKKIYKKINKNIKENIIEDVKYFIKNKNYKNIKSYKDVELKNICQNYKQLVDIKSKINYEELALSNKEILSKELIILKEKNEIIKLKIEKNKTRKLSFISKKMLYYLEIKLIKNNTRTKDVKSFLRNKSVYRKIYLSDEPPLTPTGWIKLLLSYGLMIFWAVIILWPLGELLKATTNNRAISFLDTGNTYEFGFDSFSRLFKNTLYLTWLKNTIIISLIVSGTTVFMALLMGYAFSRFRFKGKKASLLSVMMLQMVPTLAALTVFYVLDTIFEKKFNISGQVTLIIIYIGGGIAGNTFIMKGYMDSISTEIDEAARIDGLSQWKIFTRIIVPLTKPMIALVALWSFIGPFGDFILPGLLLSSSEEHTHTLVLGLRQLITDSKKMDQPAFAAGSILIAVPISILFISLRKFLVGGITAGGVKG